MKIAIDVSPLSNENRFRGVGSYTKNLIAALKQVDQKNNYFLFEDKQLPGLVDLVHYPFFQPFFLTLPLIKKTPQVVTIHDLIPLVFPCRYPPGCKGRLKFLLQKQLVKKAEAIITDSESSKKDIVNFLKINPAKVNVVYLAAEKKFQVIDNKKGLAKYRKKFALPDKFVLYVGDVNYNKNVVGLASACKLAGLSLVIVGRQATNLDFDPCHPENRSLAELIDKFGRDPKVQRLGFVSDEELVALYNLAWLYCQPSFYEGFGLPLLQAMSCGCPVVCADNSSLPEIAGQAVVYFDASRISDIAEKLKQVWSSKTKRDELSVLGLKQVKKFSWENSAKATIEVYEKAIA